MGFKWWYRHPHIQAEMRNSGSMDAVTAEILRHNQVFVLNKAMDISVVLPNGDLVYPQENIPPMEITMVELTYNYRYNSIIDDTDSILANVATQGPEVSQVDHVDELSAGASAAQGNQTAALSLRLVRALQCLAQCYHSWRMLHEKDELTKMSPEEYLEMATQKNLAIAGTDIKTLHSNARQVVRAHLKKEEGWEAGTPWFRTRG